MCALVVRAVRYEQFKKLSEVPISDRERNYINGQWSDSKSTEWQDVVNPATSEILASVPLNGGDFYTDKKVVVERWPSEWSRCF